MLQQNVVHINTKRSKSNKKDMEDNKSRKKKECNRKLKYSVVHGKLEKGHKKIKDKLNSYFISIGERETIEEPHHSNFTNHQVQGIHYKTIQLQNHHGRKSHSKTINK